VDRVDIDRVAQRLSAAGVSFRRVGEQHLEAGWLPRRAGEPYKDITVVSSDGVLGADATDNVFYSADDIPRLLGLVNAHNVSVRWPTATVHVHDRDDREPLSSLTVHVFTTVELGLTDEQLDSWLEATVGGSLRSLDRLWLVASGRAADLDDADRLLDHADGLPGPAPADPALEAAFDALVDQGLLPEVPDDPSSLQSNRPDEPPAEPGPA
jgi:hypothetical protein